MKKNKNPLLKNRAVLISCEHALNRIISPFKKIFTDPAILETHWAYDAGALHFAENLAQSIGQYFHNELICGNICRLLVDLNRPPDSKTLFTRFSRNLAPEEKEMLLQNFHHPYWKKARQIISRMLQKHPSVLHISVHSFTPELKNIVRKTDIGLLFDPKRSEEQKLFSALKKQIKQQLPEFKTHYNLPYRGTHDGLTASLRQEFSDQHYCGLELELNQKFLHHNCFAYFVEKLIPAIRETLLQSEVNNA